VSDDNANKQAQKVVSTEPVDPNKPKTTVYIKNIPEYYNNVETLNKQFKKFGPIVNIKVDMKAKMSTIEFVKPKHAKQALNNKPLFGNKEILLTDDPNMTPEDEANEQKRETILQSKLKFLVEIKKFITEDRRNLIMDLITGIKQAQKTKEVPVNLTQFVDDPIFSLDVDFSQIIEEVPANDQATLKTKLEVSLIF
jgi:RNA recognition motif. (a.k.a. RRM, RBD, or RNP domain)